MCFFLELVWGPLFVSEIDKGTGVCSVLMPSSCFHLQWLVLTWRRYVGGSLMLWSRTMTPGPQPAHH